MYNKAKKYLGLTFFWVLMSNLYTVPLSDKSQEAKLCPSYQTLVLGENYLQDDFDNSRL